MQESGALAQNQLRSRVSLGVAPSASIPTRARTDLEIKECYWQVVPVTEFDETTVEMVVSLPRCRSTLSAIIFLLPIYTNTYGVRTYYLAIT